MCVQIVCNRSCQPAALLLILSSSLINVTSGRLNETAGKFKSRFTHLVSFDTDDRLHEDDEICSGFVFLRWSDEF